jgi:hypothetical protein
MDVQFEIWMIRKVGTELSQIKAFIFVFVSWYVSIICKAKFV